MKKIISVLVAIFILAGVCTAATDDALLQLSKDGIVVGFTDGELHPEMILTRAQFARIMTEAFPDVVTTEVYYDFEDLKEDHWAAGYIQKAVNAGWLVGFPDNTVRPEDPILFEQAVTIVCRALYIAKGYESYPCDYIALAIDHSISDGVNSLIGEAINREEAAKIIVNALNYSKLQESEEEARKKTVNSASKRESGLANYSPSAVGGTYAGEREALDGGAIIEPFYFDEPDFPYNTEEYSAMEENVFKDVITSPLSTFSIDTDTASYSNLRRFILNGQSITRGVVRSEELINYFDYEKAEIEDGKPFGVKYTVSECPWNEENLLAMITVSGEELKSPKPSNIVFLIDVSGSMSAYNKLPLVKQSLSMLLDKLGAEDRVSIVTYASGSDVVLEPTPVSEKDKIISAMSELYPYGSTYGEGGIELAYEQAEKYKIDGNNRIILCTDGDFNIGRSSESELDELISKKRESGIFLSVLGFGMDNYKDNKMETLADKGNGNYAYIDNLREAKKVLVDEMPKTIYTIAKDVKIQAEFNPETVSQYRLIGYENRVLNNEDFDNDKKDAGELGAGATVTVLYEIVPQNGEAAQSLKYQTVQTTGSSDLLTIKIRYKAPDSDESVLSEYPVTPDISEPTIDFNFAAAVAELGMVLNDSDYKGSSDYDSIIDLARPALKNDLFGLKSEFIQLVDLLRYSETGK